MIFEVCIAERHFLTLAALFAGSYEFIWSIIVIKIHSPVIIANGISFLKQLLSSIFGDIGFWGQNQRMIAYYCCK